MFKRQRYIIKCICRFLNKLNRLDQLFGERCDIIRRVGVKGDVCVVNFPVVKYLININDQVTSPKYLYKSIMN